VNKLPMRLFEAGVMLAELVAHSLNRARFTLIERGRARGELNVCLLGLSSYGGKFLLGLCNIAPKLAQPFERRLNRLSVRGNLA
jgi:hypothetical protein